MVVGRQGRGGRDLADAGLGESSGLIMAPQMQINPRHRQSPPLGPDTVGCATPGSALKIFGCKKSREIIHASIVLEDGFAIVEVGFQHMSGTTDR